MQAYARHVAPAMIRGQRGCVEGLALQEMGDGYVGGGWGERAGES